MYTILYGYFSLEHLSRLHMILKPFMLRRIKKDVENELSDKIEVMVYCPLTTRQKLLYSGNLSLFYSVKFVSNKNLFILFIALKKKIRIEDLLHYTVGGGDNASNDKNFTSNLMNLVMQFRKVSLLYIFIMLIFTNNICITYFNRNYNIRLYDAHYNS